MYSKKRLAQDIKTAQKRSKKALCLLETTNFKEG
jgi:hypothetical protein